ELGAVLIDAARDLAVGLDPALAEVGLLGDDVDDAAGAGWAVKEALGAVDDVHLLHVEDVVIVDGGGRDLKAVAAGAAARQSADGVLGRAETGARLEGGGIGLGRGEDHANSVA